jgi:hypothetical protein
MRHAAWFAKEPEDQDSGNLTLNHSAGEDRSTNHRSDLSIGHDSSMRTSHLEASSHLNADDNRQSSG